MPAGGIAVSFSEGLEHNFRDMARTPREGCRFLPEPTGRDLVPTHSWVWPASLTPELVSPREDVIGRTSRKLSLFLRPVTQIARQFHSAEVARGHPSELSILN